MASKLTEICIDCSDPERIADFWCRVLGWQVTDREEGLVEIAPPGEPDQVRGGSPRLVFVQVPEPKAVKNRVHLDVNPVGHDQATELERLLALGARPVDIGQGDVRWHVLADPEGNEFCLLRTQLDAAPG